jgi:two-component system chemotaxis response regulator CheB
MPKGFTKTFADRLNELALMQVKEAEDGDRIMTGRVLIAPGDYHMKVKRSGGNYVITIEEGDKVNGHRPSVDVLMHSVAQHVAANAFGVILTGMGSDGAKGIKAMRDAGSFNIGQDEKTSVVYGMPKVAFDIGGINRQLPIDDIATALIRINTRKGL